MAYRRLTDGSTWPPTTGSDGLPSRSHNFRRHPRMASTLPDDSAMSINSATVTDRQLPCTVYFHEPTVAHCTYLMQSSVPLQMKGLIQSVYQQLRRRRSDTKAPSRVPQEASEATTTVDCPMPPAHRLESAGYPGVSKQYLYCRLSAQDQEKSRWTGLQRLQALGALCVMSTDSPSG